MASENGWEPARVGPDACEWVTVPGTSPPVRLQLMKGQPLQIMRAYAADYNAYVEHLRDADSAAWTPTNSVATSNHLNATAQDLNWELHPFRVADAGYSPQMIDTMRELLAFYEGTMFWANDWTEPKDAMHHQMGYDTYENAHTQDFINRKIRADGYSTFRRGAAPVPAPLPSTDMYALAIINEGRRRNISERGIKIALITALTETNLTMYANSNVPESLHFPHDKVGSDHDSTGLFQQRQAWGPLSCTMDPACSAGLFYDGGNAGQRGLTDFDYDNLANSPGTYAQRVQVSAFPDRYEKRWSEATDYYNRLAGVQPPPPSGQEDFLSALTDQEQRALYNEIMGQRPSRAALRPLGQGLIGDSGDAWWWTDGSVWDLICMQLAKLGHPPTLALLHQIAAADPTQYPDRQEDAELAQAVLADLAPHTEKPIAATPVAERAESTPAYTPPQIAPTPAYVPPVITASNRTTPYASPPALEPAPVQGEIVDQPPLNSDWKSPVVDSLQMLLKFDSNIPPEAVEAAEKLIVALEK